MTPRVHIVVSVIQVILVMEHTVKISMNAMLIQLVTAMLLVTTQLDHLYAHVMLDMLEWDNQETAQIDVPSEVVLVSEQSA